MEEKEINNKDLKKENSEDEINFIDIDDEKFLERYRDGKSFRFPTC